MPKGRRNVWVLCIILGLVIAMAIGCTGKTAEDVLMGEELESVSPVKDFRAVCENNVEQNPAGAGRILFDNEQNKLKGMEYYFKGEVVGDVILETTVDSGEAWLVRNEAGYVMPIHKDRFEAETGDVVEVWGTLSGMKYAASDLGIENVVGATGSMHAIEVSVH